MMRVHTLRLHERKAECDDLALVQGTARADAVRLDLDEEWAGLAVTVAFVAGSERRTPAQNADGTYTVPWECLAQAGAVRVAVEGRGEGGEVLKHARMDRPFRVLASDEAQDAPESGEPTKTEWMKLAGDARAATESANDAAADVLRRADAGEFDGPAGPQGERGEPGVPGKDGAPGEKGEKGDPGRTPVRGVDYWTEEDRAPVEAAVEAAKQAAVEAAASRLTGEVSGSVAHADDAFASKAMGLTVLGASVQRGAPKPSAPVPIASVTSADVVVAGKNLFGSTLDAAGNTVEPIFLSKGAYAISLTCEKDWWTGSQNKTAVYVHSYYGNDMLARFEFRNTGIGKRAYATADIPQDGFVKIFSYGSFANGAVSEIQLEAAEAATAYEPHRATTLPVGLQGRELCGLPDGVRDEVRIDAQGNVGLTRRVGKAENLPFKASQFSISSAGKPFMTVPFSVFPTTSAKSNAVRCDAFPYSTAPNGDAERGCYRTWNAVIFFDAAWKDGEQAARELAELNPTVLCAVPEEAIPLGRVELPTLPAPVCNAWVESDVPTECAVKYVRDANVVIEKLEKKLAAVATAAI